MLRTQTDILYEIQHNHRLSDLYCSWTRSQQEEFLNFCSGAKGLKVLYDGFAKDILSPEIHPERLNELLSLILGREVTILQALPNDSTRIADESSLLLMDIVIKLDDGSIANVEIQKIGYHFPGQRCACYSADLLLRQYKSLQQEKTKKPFSYRNIQKVYTIVLFEKSTGDFHKFPSTWLHHFQQKSDTGLNLNLLQEYYLIPLDIFRKFQHNKSVNTRFDAWLTFLSSDDPDDIISVISSYPDFKAMYEQIYEICLNTERMMEMFSKELQELDRNTVRYMIDEMQEELDQQKEVLKKNEKELEQNQLLIEMQASELEQSRTQIQMQASELEQSKTRIQMQASELEQSKTQIQMQASELEQNKTQIQMQASELEQSRTQIQMQASELEQSKTRIQMQASELEQSKTQIQMQASQLEEKDRALREALKRIAELEALSL